MTDREPRVEIIHRCPIAGEALTPCCGRSPFELLADRITLYADQVTCRGPAAREPLAMFNIIVDESMPPDHIRVVSPRSEECKKRGCDHVHEVLITDVGPAIPSSKEPTE